MNTGVFEIFSIGVGPSSSHTVGPMRAAGMLVRELAARSSGSARSTGEDLAGGWSRITGVAVELLGSLGATGRGHGTDRAVIAGLEGLRPATVDPDAVTGSYDRVRASHRLRLVDPDTDAEREITDFVPERDIVFSPHQRLVYHPNALRFRIRFGPHQVEERVFYSIGGGFVVASDASANPILPPPVEIQLPYDFRTGDELLAHCHSQGLSIAEVSARNELARGRTREQIATGLLELWQVMSASIDTGCASEGLLPGPLGVRRRAAGLLRTLKHRGSSDPMSGLDWVSLWALAVNEQNAAGGRVVTAPTNGAAGIVPAILKYALTFLPGSDAHTIHDYLLTASAIGSIYQATASISGAEVGCQGEIGVASSMAAAGLCQVLGGSPQQVVNAAEIGMEHHLGLTCDPVGGLVQIPCIERNAIGATTAITAARLALAGDGRQIVSLDEVVATMLATGKDMAVQYKETSQGGLAVNIPNC
ncbi:MAG: L-serine ammonia-lyase [Propionibacteriaceae bacterium]|jgi:L-serine dehydratase|nr:L-serine ammonia-lyase [Propionibacteriaceae bacterium]